MNYYPRAFPLAGSGLQGSDEKGMTLRDWFAGQCLPGVISTLPQGTCIGVSFPDSNLNIAMVAYALADAMLAARKDA